MRKRSVVVDQLQRRLVVVELLWQTVILVRLRGPSMRHRWLQGAETPRKEGGRPRPSELEL